jgi:hypothetical protein
MVDVIIEDARGHTMSGSAADFTLLVCQTHADVPALESDNETRLDTMSDPWLSLPLADYEGHMGADNVQQLSGALSGLFKRALDVCLPDSVAILGIAGGNGLEHANPATIKRIVGFDINPGYLDEVRRRFVTHPNLELHCVDLSQDELRVAPVALVTWPGQTARSPIRRSSPSGSSD